MLIKPNSQWLVVLIVVLSNLALIRELGRDRLRVSLARISKVGWIFVQPGTWFRVVRLLTAPEIQPVVRAHPRIVLKYLGGYLGEGLSRNERASILVNHYAFLKRRVEEDFFSKIVDGRLELWKHAVGNLLFRIYLTFSRANHDEGELSLIFQSDHVEIYTLSFTIGPGSVSGLTADHAIYIGRMQGKGRGLHLIREATKNCLDISPAALLLAAAEGIAMALELRHVVGMGADQQISASKYSRPEGLVHAYDQFWMALGGVKMDRNMYLLSTPLSEKPIKTIKQNHRSRTLRKRAFKKLVKEQVRHEFSALALRPRDQ
jgi:uncharacterized protein